jgi:hypothetical protein
MACRVPRTIDEVLAAARDRPPHAAQHHAALHAPLRVHHVRTQQPRCRAPPNQQRHASDGWHHVARLAVLANGLVLVSAALAVGALLLGQ